MLKDEKEDGKDTRAILSVAIYIAARKLVVPKRTSLLTIRRIESNVISRKIIFLQERRSHLIGNKMDVRPAVHNPESGLIRFLGRVGAAKLYAQLRVGRRGHGRPDP